MSSRVSLTSSKEVVALAALGSLSNEFITNSPETKKYLVGVQQHQPCLLGRAFLALMM